MIKRFKIAYKVFKMFKGMDALLVADIDNKFIVTGVDKSGNYVRQMVIRTQTKEEVIEELLGKVVAGLDVNDGRSDLKVIKPEDLN